MIEIKRITEDTKNDINIPNEPFTLWGKMTPTYDGNKWAYITKKIEESKICEMVFPNENYNFDELKKECYFVGAYYKVLCHTRLCLKEGFIIGFLPAIFILLPIYIGIPALILYFVIKMAIKNAIKELKNENIL